MKKLTLQEACIALAVEATTLYRWMERAHIEAETDEADKRRRTLTGAQVQQLARAHHRILPKTVKSEDLDQEDLQQRIDTLESRIEELERKVERQAASAPITPPTRPRRIPYQAEAPGEGLPDGWVLLDTLVKQYNIDSPTRKRVIRYMEKEGLLRHGDWRTEGHPATLALDQEGIAEFLHRYVTQA